MSTLVTRRNPTHPTNYRTGRSWPGGKPDCITDHVTEGSAASVRAWFAEKHPTPPGPSSALYMVTAAGGVESFGDEEDTMYHAGQLVEPSHPLVIDRYAHGRYTPNSYAIGIEHEGDGTHELTDAQRAASVALHVDICQRYGIPANRTHIFGHHEVKRSKPCPGAISVDRLVADVARALGAPVAVVADRPASHAPVLSPTLGWLVPMSVASDAVWTFATLDEIRAATLAGRPVRTMEAGAPLSAFKTATG